METLENVTCIEGVIAHMLENNTNSNEILFHGAVQALLLRRVAVAVADAVADADADADAGADADADAVAANVVRAVLCLNHDLDINLIEGHAICAGDLCYRLIPYRQPYVTSR